jgi:ABC-type transport system involved in multi-copper enzyme maturation permease subunit
VTRQLRVEVLKLRTVRLPFGLLLTAMALTSLFSAVKASQSGRAGSSVASLATASGLAAVTTVTGWSMLLAAVLGVTVATGEFRHATATLTYLAAPNRVRVLIAKTGAAAAAGALFGLVAAAVATGVGLAPAASRGDRIALSAGALAGHAAGAVLGAALLAALGVGVGSLVRSQLAAVVGVFLWALVIEALLGGFFTSVRPYLPYTAATTLAGAALGAGPGGFRIAVRVHGAPPAPGPLPFAAAAALLVGLVIASCALAARTTVRRDIT